MGRAIRVKIVLIAVVLTLPAIFAPVVQAEQNNESATRAPEQYCAEGFGYIEEKQYEKAKEIFVEGVRLHPEYPCFPFGLGKTLALQQRYEDALPPLLASLQILSTIQDAPREALYENHFELLDAYNRLGKKHYFPKELLLRMVYHEEKLIELNPPLEHEPKFMDLAVERIADLRSAEAGPNVRVMTEASVGKSIRGEPLEFQLPPDGIPQEEKARYREKAMKRLPP